MNIMEVISGVGVNGAVMHCLLLTQEFARRGNLVWVLCRKDAWIGQQLRGTTNVVVVESDMNRWPLDEIRRIAGIVRQNRIEVVHTHMTRAHNFGACLRWLGDVACVQTAHSHKVHFHWKLADHLIAVSDVTRQYHRSHNFISNRRIDTIHGFVDVSRFDVGAEARRETRRLLGISPGERLIGAIGDFLPRKGQHNLVQALPQILDRVPNARVALAGSVRVSSYMERVRAEAERLGVQDKILWLGYRQDVPQLLAAFDVYVLASLDEMFPVSVLEAMAAGLPIVVTKVGGTPECLCDPAAGLLIPPSDPQAIAKAVIDLLSDERYMAQMGAAARDNVRRHFTVEALTPEIESLFSRVVQRRTPGSRYRQV